MSCVLKFFAITFFLKRKGFQPQPEEKQVEIEQKIIESFNLRAQAKDLLEHAKRAVEIAIEQDEQAAIEWLESVVDVPLNVDD